MPNESRRKPTLSDTLDDIAKRQRALGVVVDEDDIAEEADRAVAEVRDEEAKRKKSSGE